MKDKIAERVRQHGLILKAVFNLGQEVDPVKLCQKLRRLERKGNEFGVRLCNGPEFFGEEADAKADKILADVDALLNFKARKIPVFLNRDPRGYALKIDDQYIRARRDAGHSRQQKACGQLHTDWGGYGIIAPDLTRES